MASTANEKFALVNNLLQQATTRNISEEESVLIRCFLKEQSATIHTLEEDNQKMKQTLSQQHDELLRCKQKTSEIIPIISTKVTDIHLKVLQIEDRLTQFGLDVIQLETNKVKQLDDMSRQWQEKLKGAESHTEKTVEEIVRKHCEAKKTFEIVILGLKEQVAHKEAEVAWCQLRIKERDYNIDKEISNLKRNLELTTLKNQELLQQRLIDVEKKANRMTQKCLKLQQGYEHKMSLLKKEKDLQVEALKRQVMCQTQGNNIKLENALKELELRYKKILISLHEASQQQGVKAIEEFNNECSSMRPEPNHKT